MSSFSKRLFSFVVLYYFIWIVLPGFLLIQAQSANSSYTSPSTLLRTRRLNLSVAGQTVLVQNKTGKQEKKLLVSDYLSTTKVVVDENGSVSSYPSYYPYGSQTSNLNLDSTNKYFTGQKKVTNDSDLYNYNARYYSPDIGVFIQPDSVEGPNRFAYVAGNPISATDPTGNGVCGFCNTLHPNNPNVADPIPDIKTKIKAMLKIAGVYDIGSLGLMVFDTITGVGYRSDNDPFAAASSSLNHYVSKGDLVGADMVAMVQPMSVVGGIRKGVVAGNVTVERQLMQGVADYARVATENLIPPHPLAIAQDAIEGVDSFRIRPGTQVRTIADLIDPNYGNRVRSFTVPGKLANENYLYVLKQDGELLLGTRTKGIARSPHSAIAGGDPVISAGNIHFREGKVMTVDVASGHYRPDDWRVSAVWNRLKEIGIPFAEGGRGLRNFGAHTDVHFLKYATIAN